ncbi:MAG: hypothetical protein V3U92_14260 [Cellulophaga sp.]
MKRVLIDYKKLNHEIAALLIENYPHGYGDEDIISFKNHKGDLIKAVEIKTTDTLYLVKISKSLSNFITNFDDKVIKELELKPNSNVQSSLVQEMEVELSENQE